ncbi:MAG: MBL fold metallo-hydrolase [Eubacteriales bacterium]|nr:MBL fold metallo-hydrolase [Eubacteriales bacterium]
MGRTRLQKIGPHTWIFPLDSAKDRPNLGYVQGEKMAVAIDAGHSSSHVEDFYAALEREMLPLPDLTVITHWHWDHTFGLHAVHGRTLARPETNSHLEGIREQMRRSRRAAEEFLNSDACIRREYAGGVPLVVVPAQEEITEDRSIDLGGVTLQLCYAESPHTEDALLAYVPEDRVLFVGDAQLGEFPTWRMDFERLDALAEQVRGFDAKTIVDGHWSPYRKEDYLAEL